MSKELVRNRGPVTNLVVFVSRNLGAIRHDYTAPRFDEGEGRYEPLGFALSDAFADRVVVTDWADLKYLWCAGIHAHAIAGP
jgi:hypothetical protein